MTIYQHAMDSPLMIRMTLDASYRRPSVDSINGRRVCSVAVG